MKLESDNKYFKTIAKKLYKEIDKSCKYDIKPTLSLCLKTVKEDFRENMSKEDLLKKSKESINLIINGY